MLLKVAWRNIWRSRKRSLIIIAAVIIGFGAGIFLMAFYNGMIEQRVRSAIEKEISHLQLHHPGFTKDQDIKFFIKDGSTIVQKIRSDADIKSATDRIIIKGMIASASGSSGITINGIEPDGEDKVTNLSSKLIEGNYFSEKPNEILLGEKLLKKLKLKKGNKAILTFQDTAGNIASAAFRISGIYKTVNTPYDETNVFVRINDIDSLALLKDQVNEIAVLLNRNEDLNKKQTRYQNTYPSLDIQNWMEIAPEIGLTVSVSEQMVLIFMGIILLALAFGIINTMLMAVLERTREIGMLLALGMNKLKIFKMILYETTFLVLVGCPGGIVISLAAVYWTNKTGISFKKYTEVYSSFGFENIIYPSITLNQFLLSMLLVIITAIISSLFPAWRALRLKPAEAIRK